MPAYWSKKDERMYQHIKESCMTDPKRRKKGRTAKDCKRMAASTVNRQRREEGRTLTALGEEGKRVCLHPCTVGIGILGTIIGGIVVGAISS